MQMATDLLRRTVIENPFIPKLGGQFPSAPQAFFLTAPVNEILYGGAAGGGKSAGILAAALQYVAEPGYDAIILRRSYADLEKPGGLIPLSIQWLTGKAKYNPTQHRWTFPSGATLSFGFIQNDNSVIEDFQGSAFSFIGFDELTQFSRFMYTYLFSRKRKSIGLPFPTRVRATSNPGGNGHEWVKSRFLDAADGVTRLFVPAKLEDNPGLDKQDYEQALEELDPVTRRQLRHGDWSIRPEGNMFKREWFARSMVDDLPPLTQSVRYWDLAATKPKRGKDPDYASGCRMGIGEDGYFYIADMRRFREMPRETENRVLQTTRLDGRSTFIRIEQEPGASAKLYIDSLARLLASYDVRGIPSSTDKVTRARPFSAACERGDVKLVRGPWVETFLDEICAFPAVEHDDQVDAASGAYNQLAGEPEPWNPEDYRKAFAYDD